MAGGLQQDPGNSWLDDKESGEDGGDGKVEHIRRGRVALSGAQTEEE